jgi:hypothetical protein
MFVRLLRRLALLFAVGAALAPLAHILELPNKFRLEGRLWLGVQQHLYNGWGPIIGAPTEIGGLLISLALVVASRGRKELRLFYGASALAYIAMVACFFLLNDPVNKALSGWTPETMPANWTTYRLRWETGHALAGVFAFIAIMTTGAAIVAAEKTNRK